MSLARSASANPSPSYERHQPEHTLLYQLVEQHYPIFKASLEDQGQSLPHYIQQEFDDFLQCGRLEYGFLRLRCEDCHHERLVAFSCKTLMGEVLSTVYRTLSTHLIKQAGYTKATAHTGSVTLIQRFGSALNPNLHFHLLFLDGVYAEDADGKQRFHRVKAPSHCHLNTLVHTLTYRIATGPQQGRKIFILQTLPEREDKADTQSSG